LDDSPSSVYSSFGYERPYVTHGNDGLRTEDVARKAEVALQEKKVKELKKEDPKISLLTKSGE